jgi:hypothetical protein
VIWIQLDRPAQRGDRVVATSLPGENQRAVLRR